jgi:hypothetical protein
VSRTSRIRHPSGGRFIQLHAWAVGAVGRDGAAVLGLMDFLDRAQDQPGRPLASRSRIIADLQGLVGRNAIDGALARLVDLDWLRLHVDTRVKQRNLSTTHYYSLNAAAVTEYVVKNISRRTDFGKSGFPISGGPESLAGDRPGENAEHADSAPGLTESPCRPDARDGGACPAPLPQKEKSENTPTTPTVTHPGGGGGISNIDDLVDAALWEATSVGLVKYPTRYRAKVRSRLMHSGPTPEDMETLARWQDWLSRQTRINQSSLETATQSRQHPPAGWKESVIASLSVLSKKPAD